MRRYRTISSDSARLRRLGQFTDVEGDAPEGETPDVPEGDAAPEGESVETNAAVTGDPVEDAAALETPTVDAIPDADGTEGGDPVVADAGDGAPADLGDDRWHAIIFVEGVTTNDGREAAAGAISMRPPPLPLQYTEETTWGHDGATMGGMIETIMRDPELAAQLAEAGFISLADGAILFVAEGGYAETENGQYLRGMVNRQELRFVSVDLEILAAEEVYPLDDPYGYGILRVTQGNIMGATVCPFPAFQQCVIAPLSMSLFDAATQGFDANASTAISTAPSPVAIAASGGPDVPPATWFTSPRFGPNDREDSRLVEDPDHPGKFYCPFTLASDGRIFGHAAAWHRDHIGVLGQKIKPPKSKTNYAYMCTGTAVVLREDGSDDVIRCGVLTMNTGHAPTSGPGAGAAAAKRHYDDTGTQVALIEMGEDEHGIWFSGALIPTISAENERALRAGGVSGDWRPQGAGSEMVALLAVNVPGFPMPRVAGRSYRVDNGEERELALVAAGFVPPRDPAMDMVQAQLAPLRDKLAELERLVAPILVERMLGP